MLHLKNRRGFSMVEVVVATGMATIGALSLMAIMNVMSKKKSETENLSWAYDLRFEVNNVVNNKTAFEINTINASTSMTCLRNQTSCTGQGGPVDLRDASNRQLTLVVPPGNATRGITRKGAVCDTFGSSPDCIYRYEVTWTPICAAGSNCKSPQVQINGQMKVSPMVSGAAQMKMSSFNLTINKIEKASMDVAQICGFLKGSMSGSKCILPAGNACSDPSRPYLLGYDSDGRPLCGYESANTHCPDGGVMTSLNSDGTFSCVDGCSGSGVGNGTFVFSL